ncbi:MAG TPA: hypothetical protein V6D02_10180 [Candidatus Obscuribacterales bacterium]
MGVEFLILTVYFICIVYVLYQMALSVEAKLEDQVEIVLLKDHLEAAVNEQLRQQTLYRAEAKVQPHKDGNLLKITFFDDADQVAGAIGLQVSPTGKRPLQPPLNHLGVSVANTLPDQQVFINWDYSALSVYGGPAQRVIRQIPGRPTDLFQPQVVTVVNPGLQTTVAVTGENLLTRPESQISLEFGSTLIDLSRMPEMKEPMRQYSLRILLWVRSMANPNSPAMQLLVPFDFCINVLPDHVALPILSWLLNFDPFVLNPLGRRQ